MDSGFDFVTKEFVRAYLDMLMNEKSIPWDEKEFSPKVEKAFLNGSQSPFDEQEIWFYEDLIVKLPIMSDSTVIKVTEKDNKDYPGTLIVGFREG
ncbi:MAG: hypothetical protein JW870_14210 [Candidatus Delongbacteria bacterium]|nr:hypothetical protein [Candidatus Delongbacteria bacterium]